MFIEGGVYEVTHIYIYIYIYKTVAARSASPCSLGSYIVILVLAAFRLVCVVLIADEVGGGGSVPNFINRIPFDKKNKARLPGGLCLFVASVAQTDGWNA